MPLACIRVLLVGPGFSQDVISAIRSSGQPGYCETGFSFAHCADLESIELVAVFKPHCIVTVYPEDFPKLSSLNSIEYGKWIRCDGDCGNKIGSKIIEVFKSLTDINDQANPTLVSVFTPLYKTTTTDFSRAYNSLIAQTYANWEWVLFRDDESLNIPVDACIRDYRVRIYTGRHSGDIGAVKRLCASLCNGTILVELDHDDELMPHCLNDIVSASRAHPECGFFYTHCAEVSDGIPKARYGKGFGMGYGSYRSETYDGKTFDVQVCGPINSATMRYITGVPNHARAWTKSAYWRAGGHNKYLPVCDDYDLIIRTFLTTKMCLVDRCGYIQHYHSSNSQDDRRPEIQRLSYILSYQNAKLIHDRIVELGGDDSMWVDGAGFSWNWGKPKYDTLNVTYTPPPQPSKKNRPMIIAMYLPGFHRDRYNDSWWGDGFTEWDNLKTECAIQQNFKLPHRDIGYYDLKQSSARRIQALTAKRFGIDGFCVYHYWFSGETPLSSPYELMLIDGEPDIPFMLCWANETWTRQWRNLSSEVLIEQTYGGPDEWDAHFKYLLPFFKHKNYIRVDGEPVFCVYIPSSIPDFYRRINHYKILARDNGLGGIHIVQILGGGFRSTVHECVDAVAELAPTFKPMRELLSLGRLHRRHYRGVSVGWNNSPRRPIGHGRTLDSSSASEFEDSARIQMNRTDDFLFVNSWNEWGEQAALEPSDSHGYSYLRSMLRARSKKTSLAVVTACTRLENLPALEKSVSSCELISKWVIVIDQSIGRDAIPPLRTDGRIAVSIKYGPVDTGLNWRGEVNKNIGLLEVSNSECTHVYFLDDDNILHPTFCDEISLGIPDGDIIMFDQQVDETTTRKPMPIVRQIDQAQYIVKLSCLNGRSIPLDYCGDGRFAEEISKSGRVVYIEKTMSYYNRLRWD